MVSTGLQVVQVVSAVVLVAGGDARGAARDAVRRALSIATSDPVDPTNARATYGRLTGTAMADGQTVEAPFTGADCLAYDCAVAEEGDDLLETNTVRTETRAIPFVLDVDGRRVSIVPAGASVELVRASTVDVSGGEEPPPRIQAYNEEADLAPQHTPVDAGVVELSRGWDREYVEGRVEPGDEVTVVGDLRRPRRADPDVDAIVDGGAPAFAITDRGPVGAAIRSERSPLLLLGGTLAAVAVGTWMLAASIL